jgi:hypothetical protein
MKKKLLFFIAPIFLTFTTTAFSHVYCPPGEVVHCTKGICIVDAPYSNDWRVFVTGYPNDSLKFAMVSIYSPPRTAICQYGNAVGHRLNFYTLRSISNYSPSLKVPGNQWMFERGFHHCTDDRMACPMQ